MVAILPPVVIGLHRRGGVATWAELRTGYSRGEVEAAVERGEIVRVARGRYALPTKDHARRAAHELSGVAVLLSAAAHWGWRTKWQPRRRQVAVPRGRRVLPEVQRRVAVSWRTLPADDVHDGWVTSPVRTVLDCAAFLAFDEALAVADSALRSRRVSHRQLRVAAEAMSGRGRQRALRVVRLASAEAANPMESVLRAVVADVRGLRAEPQVRVGVDGHGEESGRFLARADLGDVHLRILLEAEGFEFHGEADMLARDCARYDELVVRDWLVLRFSWDQVMNRPDWVREMVRSAVVLRTHRRPLVGVRA